MELNRLQRVIKARWWLIVAVSVVGFLAALGFTVLGNRDLNPVFEATIPLRFELQGDEDLASLADEVTNASELAILAGGEILSEYPGSSVFPDTASGRLLFIARANTREEALSRATELIDAYYAADPVAGGDLQAQLETIETQAEEISTEIETLQPQLTTGQRQLIYDHQLLDLSIAAVQNQIVQLTVADATASEEELAANDEARASLNATLQGLTAEKTALPPVPSEEASTAAQLRLDALTTRLDLLRTEYQNISLRLVGISAGEVQESAIIVDLTPNPANPLINGLIGFVIGAGFALLVLVISTRLRKEVWLPDDVPVPVLSQLPTRRPVTEPGPSWYDSTTGGRRKESIQTLRTALDGLLGHGSTGLAVTGVRVGSEAAQALAADIAGSFASAGRSVLLIDADYSEPSTSAEYDVGEPSLTSILLRMGESRTNEKAQLALEDAMVIRSNLAVIPAGDVPDSPADLVAGGAFRHLVDTARTMFDVVVVAAGDGETATAQVIAQRLGSALIAITPGKTTSPQLSGTLADLRQQRVELPGVVMLQGSESRSRRSSRPRSRRDQRESHGDPGALGRLGSYPFPGSKRSTDHTDGSLDGLRMGLTSGDEPPTLDEDPLGSQVLAALRSADSATASALVADYLVARVEDLMTAVPGQDNVSEDLINRIGEFGFIPITSVRGQSTIGDCLSTELELEIGESTAEAVLTEISRVIGEEDVNPVEGIDRWVSDEFFRRHIQRTDGAPEVWHIKSRSGLIELLVAARKLNDDRLGLISTSIVRRKIDELEKQKTSLIAARTEERVPEVEAKLREAHEFERTLVQLRVGSTDEARLVYPWRGATGQPRGWKPVWAEGVRANIAPLQRLDLLAAPVLSDEDMDSLVAV